jgi:hypothetical protein
VSDFPKFNKIPRLNRDIRVTEKIDGTNGLIWIGETVEDDGPWFLLGDGCTYVRAGSRSRWLEPTKMLDNHHFATWVYEHAEDLAALGCGHHYGEWWGLGIQRGYGVTDKRFSMFWEPRHGERPDIVGIVPTLYEGPWAEFDQAACLADLQTNGSRVAPFMRPEGIVLEHLASGQRYKVTLEGDAIPKSRLEAA